MVISILICLNLFTIFQYFLDLLDYRPLFLPNTLWECFYSVIFPSVKTLNFYVIVCVFCLLVLSLLQYSNFLESEVIHLDLD